MSAAAAAPRAGRQRSEAADEAILAATLELLSQVGYGALTVSGVIDRAGVSSATLYRRWPTKQDLVAAALASLSPEPAGADTGSLDGDLAAMLTDLARSIEARQRNVAESLTLEVRRNPELADALKEKVLEPRRRQVAALLARAEERGELVAPPSLDVALSLVLGPVYHRAYVVDEPLTEGWVEATCALVLGGLRAVAAPPRP